MRKTGMFQKKSKSVYGEVIDFPKDRWDGWRFDTLVLDCTKLYGKTIDEVRALVKPYTTMNGGKVYEAYVGGCEYKVIYDSEDRMVLRSGKVCVELVR